MRPIIVKRAIHLRARPGESLYAFAGYASRAGLTLVENIQAEALHFSEGGGRHYYTRRIIRRRSDDNGAAWRVLDEWSTEPGNMRQPGEHWHPLNTFLLPGPNILVERRLMYVYRPEEKQFGLGNSIARTYRTFCRYSRDAGETWSEWRQVIDRRPEYNAQHWAPGVDCGVQGGVGDGQVVLMDNATILMGFTIREPKAPPEDVSARARELYSTVIFAQGRWDADRAELSWTFGANIAVPFPEACGGGCEPALVRLAGGRWMVTMRCQGDAKLQIPSRRMAAISADGGMTWTRPAPLSYADGSTVWTPAAVHSFYVSNRTGKTYLIANLLPGPVYGQTPRYPLCLAEFDVERAVVLKETAQVIQDRPAGAPEDRRYTNFGQHEDRATGELVLCMPEHPLHKNYADMTVPADYTGDCLIYRIRLPEA